MLTGLRCVEERDGWGEAFSTAFMVGLATFGGAG